MELDFAEMLLEAAVGSVAPYAAVAIWDWIHESMKRARC